MTCLQLCGNQSDDEIIQHCTDVSKFRIMTFKQLTFEQYLLRTIIIYVSIPLIFCNTMTDLFDQVFFIPMLYQSSNSLELHQWNANVAVLIKFSSVAAPETSGDQHFIKMITFPLPCFQGTKLFICCHSIPCHPVVLVACVLCPSCDWCQLQRSK